jgi:hypothetical protein
MLRLQEESRENHRRFVERIVASETVWMLDSGNGAAYCESNEEEERPVLMFWSDRAYSERVRQAGFEDCQIDSCSLFDFLFRWLPGMEGDGALVGTNWSGDLAGTECEPAVLHEEIVAAMTEGKLQEYRERLRREIEEQKRGK